MTSIAKPLSAVAALCMLWIAIAVEAQAFDLEQCDVLGPAADVPEDATPEGPPTFLIDPVQLGTDLECVLSQGEQGGYEYHVLAPVPDHADNLAIVFTPATVTLVVPTRPGRYLRLATCSDQPTPEVRLRCRIYLQPSTEHDRMVEEFDANFQSVASWLELDLTGYLTAGELRNFARVDADARSVLLLPEGRDMPWTLAPLEIETVYRTEVDQDFRQALGHLLSDDPRIRVEIQWTLGVTENEEIVTIHPDNARAVLYEYSDFALFVVTALTAQTNSTQ